MTTSLGRAAAKPTSARGWAATRRVGIPKARQVGASRPEFFTTSSKLGGRMEDRCQAEECGDLRADNPYWCPFHAARAASLGATKPPPKKRRYH